MSNQTILIVAHGSRIPEAGVQFHASADALAAHLGRPVRRCFLELADPDLATGLSDAAKSVGEGGEVKVLPLFLGAAGHQKNDVAFAIQWAREQFPAVTFHFGPHLGSHAKLIELLDLRVGQCLEADDNALPLEETIVLVVGRGSSDPDNNSTIAKIAHLLFEKRPYQAVEYAFQIIAQPLVDEGLRRCKLLGARQVVVAPYILFTGRVDQAIRNVSQRTGTELGLRVLQAQYLGVHSLLADVMAQRLQEVMESSETMTCDLCKYRFPMAGYEHQVGQPQTSHHLHGGLAHSHDHDHHHHHHHEHL